MIAAAEQYLQRLSHGLRTLPKDDRDHILNEIRSHFAERGAESDAAMARAVEAMGPPQQLAGAFLEDAELSRALVRSAPGQLLAAVLDRASRSLAAFLIATGAVLLYVFSLSFMAVAVLKPVAPRNVGLWSGPGVFDFGVVGQAPAGARELLGLAVTPLAAVSAVLCYLAATLLMKRFAPRLLSRRTALAA